MEISQIIVGNRTRKHLGDIQQLADSISSIGLLHPIVISPDNKLIAGYRRIMAYKMLSRDEIPHTIVDDLDGLLATLAEQHENTCRLDFTPSEAVEIGRLIEPLEREAAKERQKIAGQNYGNGKVASENFTQAKSRTLDKVAAVTGLSRPTYSKAVKVVEAAEKQPDLFYIVTEMDETGKVDRAMKELNRVRKLEERQKSTPQIPQTDNIWHGKFQSFIDRIPPNSVDLIFTDPPYVESALEVYRDLSKFASIVLKPGGLCLAYSGQIFLPQILSHLSENLTYGWTLAIRHTGGYTQIFKVRCRNMWKPILMFYKPPLEIWWKVFDDMVDGKMQKDSHEWQQALNEAEYYINMLCPPDGLIVDPFAGSGTSLVAAKKLGRQFIGIEDDAEDIQKIVKRLNDTPEN